MESALAPRASPPGAVTIPRIRALSGAVGGGAEWVELARGGTAKRVVFEHGASVPGIQPLVEKVREIRGRMLER